MSSVSNGSIRACETCKRMELLWIGIGTIAAIVVAAIAYRAWRKRKRDDKPGYYKNYPLW